MLRAPMRLAEGLRSEALIRALDEAISGKPARLYAELGLQSGLPGTRMNMAVANAFAVECASRGKKADKLAFEMANLHPDIARGATEHEFLPVCGVLALAARAAREPSLRPRVLTNLHDVSDDPRFRVRQIVPVALAKVGEHMGDELVTLTASWTDGFFQAAAVLLALSENGWLAATNDADQVLCRLDEAFTLAAKAQRAASRYPGRKALVDALGTAPAAIALRYGAPVFELLARWSVTKMPELREAIEANLRSKKLAGRFGGEIDNVHHALKSSATPPRDPTLIIAGMRSRGKKRTKR